MKNYLKSVLALVSLMLSQSVFSQTETLARSESSNVKVVSETKSVTAPLVKDISFDEAFDKIKMYDSVFNGKKMMSHYVWTSSASLKEMANHMLEQGSNYVKIYFAAENKMGIPVMTLIFEGAAGDSHLNECDDVNGNGGCELTETKDVTTKKPFNLVHPCPPPKCKGYSRYYNAKGEIQKLP